VCCESLHSRPAHRSRVRMDVSYRPRDDRPGLVLVFQTHREDNRSGGTTTSKPCSTRSKPNATRRSGCWDCRSLDRPADRAFPKRKHRQCGLSCTWSLRRFVAPRSIAHEFPGKSEGPEEQWSQRSMVLLMRPAGPRGHGRLDELPIHSSPAVRTMRSDERRSVFTKPLRVCWLTCTDLPQ